MIGMASRVIQFETSVAAVPTQCMILLWLALFRPVRCRRLFMVRLMLLFAVLLALAVGCSQSAPSTLTERAEIDLRKGNYGTAIDISSEALVLDPLDAQAYLVRGRAHHYRNQKGDIERAIADFSEAIRLAPNESEAYYSRSIAYRDHGDADESKEDEGKARELDPRVNETYSHLPTPKDTTVSLPPNEPEPSTAETPSDPADPLKLRSENYGDYLRLKRQFESGSPQKADAADGRESGPTADSPLAPRMRKPGQANDEPPAKFGDNNNSRSQGRDGRNADAGYGTTPDGSVRGRDPLRGQPPSDQHAGPATKLGPAGRGQQADLGPQRPTIPRQGAESRPLVQNPFAGGVGNPASPWQRPFQFPVGTGSPSQTPFQTPFPQRAPRPTGFVEPPLSAAPAQSPQNRVPFEPPISTTPDDFSP